MSLTVNAKTYAPDSYQKDMVVYVGPGKTVSAKDDLKLSRTAPKPVATFSGLGRTTSKLTRTVTLTGAVTPTGEAIIEVNVSVPVGMAGADIDTLLNDYGSHVASASFKTHVKNQMITF